MFLRAVVERLSRGVVFKKKLPTQFGSRPIYVTPDANLSFLKWGDSAFDLGLLEVALKHVGLRSVVWDIGANVGVFAFSAAHLAKAGSVLAVECDITLVQIMQKTRLHKLNHDMNLTILPAAISNRNGMEELLIAQRGRSSNALRKFNGRSQMGGVRDKVFVPTITLDTLLVSIESPPNICED